MQSRHSGSRGSGVLSWLRETVAEADEEPSPYTCQTCESAFAVEHYRCPNCGGFSVER